MRIKTIQLLNLDFDSYDNFVKYEYILKLVPYTSLKTRNHEDIMFHLLGNLK